MTHKLADTTYRTTQMLTTPTPQADSTAVTTAAGPDGHTSNATAGEASPGRQDGAHRAEAKARHTAAADTAQAGPAPAAATHSAGADTIYIFGHGLEAAADTADDEEFTITPYFMNDSLANAHAGYIQHGVAGDPVPYTIRGDNTITALLLACFVTALVAFANSRRFFMRQAKHFFSEPKRRTNDVPETTAEVRFQFFFVMQTCLLLSIITFLYTLDRVADTFMLDSQYQLVTVFFGIYVGYFALKMLTYWIVNSIFFGGKKSADWLKSLLFATSVEGIALFPAVLLMSYFDLSIQKAIIYVIFVIVLVKMMLLYKSFVMFFKHKTFFLQIILYFCALEITPLLSLGGVLVKVVEYLKINF